MKPEIDFIRVTLDNVLRADTDGMPVFRHCFEYEIMMRFWDDNGAYAFAEWWEDAGSRLFGLWLSNHENSEYRQLVK